MTANEAVIKKLFLGASPEELRALAMKPGYTKAAELIIELGDGTLLRVTGAVRPYNGGQNEKN